jgi:glucosamine-phosphate N-acetyltransferase
MSTHDEPLFPPQLISTTVQEALPAGYKCRPLQKSDYHAGFLDVLRVLTTVGEISEERWNERYDFFKARSDAYFLLVILDESREPNKRIVGTGALIVERKL